MQILMNTDHTIDGNEEMKAPLEELLRTGLKRFDKYIERLDVHLTDENGDKGGENDKRCLLGVQLIGLHPVVVTNHSDTHHFAVKGALEKLKHSLETVLGRLQNH